MMEINGGCAGAFFPARSDLVTGSHPVLQTIAIILCAAAAAAAGVAWWRGRSGVAAARGEADRLRRENLGLEHQLAHARRMEAVGILSGSIVHNLNNLLAVILGHARMAAHTLPSNSGAHEEIGKVVKAGTMASELVSEISDFFRQADRARKPTDLGPLVGDTLKLLRDILPGTVEIRDNLQDCGPVLASPAGVQQVLMNLCSNSVQAMADGQGVIEVTLAEEKVTGWHRAVPADLGPGSYVKLTVRDNGRGMDNDTLERMFESYFSTSAGATKLGIGLSTVCRILKEHDGTTIPSSRAGAGTAFDIYFPLIAWPADQEPEVEILPEPNLVSIASTADEDEAAASGAKGLVLLVDDETMVAQVMARGLRRLGYGVVMHTDARDALADFARAPASFDAVVTDQIMPHMSGVRLTRRMHDIRADVPVILFTGFRDSFNERQAREAGVSEFMLKPGSHRDLAQLLDRVMARRQAGQA
jgi:signal transduction histidine kinase/ActR/RegA family two-component response regulator